MSWARAGLDALAWAQARAYAVRAWEQIEARRAALARREFGGVADDAEIAERLSTAGLEIFDFDHHYLSTACMHRLCGRKVCRLTCKYCGAACLCQCHREGGSEAVGGVVAAAQGVAAGAGAHQDLDDGAAGGAADADDCAR